MLPTNRPPTHPGEMLVKEFLEPLGVSQVEAAKRMNIPFQRLNAIVKGHRGVSADTALLFEALHAVGRSDLVDTPGEVGPVARHEGSRSTAQGAGLAEDGVVEDVAWPGSGVMDIGRRPAAGSRLSPVTRANPPGHHVIASVTRSDSGAVKVSRSQTTSSVQERQRHARAARTARGRSAAEHLARRRAERACSRT